MFSAALNYVLERIGKAYLKKQQVASVHAIYRRNAVFVWLPTTGFGKTVCYEVFHFVFETLVLIHSWEAVLSPSWPQVTAVIVYYGICIFTVTSNTIHVSN